MNTTTSGDLPRALTQRAGRRATTVCRIELVRAASRSRVRRYAIDVMLSEHGFGRGLFGVRWFSDRHAIEAGADQSRGSTRAWSVQLYVGPRLRPVLRPYAAEEGEVRGAGMPLRG